MSHVSNKSNGFTLVELTLAMGFVAALLIAVVMTVIQIGNIYNKGITMKEVDQMGRSLSNEIKSSISQSVPFKVDITSPLDPDSKYIKQYTGSKQTGGRLCIGQYSYIWNFGEAINTSPSPVSFNKYFVVGPDVIRFVKVVDNTGLYCKETAPSSGVYPDIEVASKPVELLKSGDISFAIQSFSIEKIASDSKTKQTLYKINFILGTNDIGSIKASYSECKAPGEVGSSQRDSTFCALNYFQMVVRSGNIIQ